MKKQSGQDDDQERPRRRARALDGAASGAPQPDMPEDQAELQAIAGGKGKQGRALQQKVIDAFHARGDAARADIERGGKTYSLHEVVEEMRALTAARRRQLEGESPVGGSSVKRWLTATEAADLVGVARPFMSRIFDSGVIQIVVDADDQRRALESHVLAWHEQFRAHQRGSMHELSRHGDDEYS